MGDCRAVEITPDRGQSGIPEKSLGAIAGVWLRVSGASGTKEISGIAARKSAGRAGALFIEGSKGNKAGEALGGKGTGAGLAGAVAGRAEEVGGVAAHEILGRTGAFSVEWGQFDRARQALSD